MRNIEHCTSTLCAEGVDFASLTISIIEFTAPVRYNSHSYDILAKNKFEYIFSKRKTHFIFDA